MDSIVVTHGDTATVQHGVGTFGSRNTAVGGTALVLAIRELKEKIESYGAMLLESDDVTYGGGVCTCNKTGKTVPLAEIALTSYIGPNYPPDTQPGLVATNYWEPPNFAFPFGAHVVVTEVDRDTGQVAIKRYLAVDDCGKVITLFWSTARSMEVSPKAWARLSSKRWSTMTPVSSLPENIWTTPFPRRP